VAARVPLSEIKANISGTISLTFAGSAEILKVELLGFHGIWSDCDRRW